MSLQDRTQAAITEGEKALIGKNLEASASGRALRAAVGLLREWVQVQRPMGVTAPAPAPAPVTPDVPPAKGRRAKA
jgi:hypothetical protein